jgi:CHASE3 domain sensor protein
MDDGAAQEVRSAELQRDGSARTFRRAIMGVLGAGLIALVAMAGVAAWLVNRAHDFSRWTDHTYVVQNDINQLAAMIEQTETARRGYLLVPNPQYRKTYEEVGARVGNQIDRIAIDTFDNPTQRQNIAALRALEKLRDARISEVMRLASAGLVDQAVAIFKLDRDHPMLRPIRATIAAMMTEEHRLLAQRLERERENADILLAVVLTGGGLLVFLTLGAMVLMRRYAADLGRAQKALSVLNSPGRMRKSSALPTSSLMICARPW